MRFPLLLDPAPFRLDVGAILHPTTIPLDDAVADSARTLVGQAESVARPRAFLRAARVDRLGDDGAVVVGGVRLVSHLLQRQLEGNAVVYPFLATCGRELDAWAAAIDPSDLLGRYFAEVIKEHAVQQAVAAALDRLQPALDGQAVGIMNPGSLEDWPLTEQASLFRLFEGQDRELGVTLTESSLMVPTKSVSGLAFASATGFVPCQLCSRPDCPGRRAPYNPAEHP